MLKPRQQSGSQQIAQSIFRGTVLASSAVPAFIRELTPFQIPTRLIPILIKNYGQLDINTGASEGIGLGTSGGDQEYMTEEGIGPAGDKRTSIRPSLNLGTDPFDRYMNFAINDEWFGPPAPNRTR